MSKELPPLTDERLKVFLSQVRTHDLIAYLKQLSRDGVARTLGLSHHQCEKCKPVAQAANFQRERSKGRASSRKPGSPRPGLRLLQDHCR
jgi:predicted secreted Zn-dependent protease